VLPFATGATLAVRRAATRATRRATPVGERGRRAGAVRPRQTRNTPLPCGAP
jgi:hypothetical protein